MNDTDLDTIPKLDPDALYEECPRCEGRCNFCMTCWDEGLVLHECAEDE